MPCGFNMLFDVVTAAVFHGHIRIANATIGIVDAPF